MTRISLELHGDTVNSMDQRTSKPGPAVPAPNTPEREFHVRPNWVEVDGTAMAHNVRALRRLAGPDVKVFAALKGNACGFGVAEAARVIAAAGADALATVDLGDAIRIRKHGVRLPLLLYGGNLPTAEAVRAVLDYDLTPTFHDRYSAEGFLRLADAPLRAQALRDVPAGSTVLSAVGVVPHGRVPVVRHGADTAANDRASENCPSRLHEVGRDSDTDLLGGRLGQA